MHHIRPRIGVDDVEFGTDIDSLLASGYSEDPTGFDDVTGWRTFNKTKELDCYANSNEVVCIACFADCEIKGTSIIGRDLASLLSALGPPDEIGESVWIGDKKQVPYEYFNLGLQFWVEAGAVVSVFCNAIY